MNPFRAVLEVTADLNPGQCEEELVARASVAVEALWDRGVVLVDARRYLLTRVALILALIITTSASLLELLPNSV